MAVRYRYDPQRRRRTKTVELVEEEVEWIQTPPLTRNASDLVLVKADFLDLELRGLLKQAGGRWDPRRKAWLVRYSVVVDLGIHSSRVESP